MSVYYETNKARNPQLRELLDEIMDITSGHSHDGVNTKAVVGGVPGAGSVTDAMLNADVKVGSLAALTTTVKTSVQGAINELDADVGDKSTLTTTAKTNLVVAVNEIDSDVGTLASLNTTTKISLVAAVNEVNTAQAGNVTLTGVQALTNKTLTSAVLTTCKIDDSDAGLTITSANQTNAAAIATIPDIVDAADEFVLKDTAATLTLKTLTNPKIVTGGAICDAGGDKYVLFTESTTPATYIGINSGDTTVMPQVRGAGEINTGLLLAGTGTGKVTIGDGATPTKKLNFELIGATATKIMTITSSHTDDRALTLPDATDTLVGRATTDTLTNKTLTAPIMHYTASAHDYAAGSADWTLNAAELKTYVLTPTNANAPVNAIIADTAYQPYFVINATGQALTVKTAAGTGISIANAKNAIVMSNGVNVIRVTADA